MRHFALIAALALPGILFPAAEPEQLAGEKEEAKQPQSRPTAVEPEQGGAVSLTRSTKAAPSFELPEFVITGSGARKAVGTRPDLNVWMDTSGGIKASPGEEDASKNQLGAQGARQAMEALSETARPSYGQLRALYGLSNTFLGEAFFGQELGGFYYLLQGENGFSDGGPVESLPTINQSGRMGVLARGGWRLGAGRQLSGEAFARRRTRMWTSNPAPAPRLEREWQGGRLRWEGSPSDKVRHSLQASVDRSQALLPGLGTAYVESLISLKGSFEGLLETRHSRTRLRAEAYVSDLCQDNGARVPLLAGAWFMAGFEPWKGAKLGLGLSLDSASGGGLSALLVAPRGEFEQRLGGGFSAWARFAPGLSLPTFAGPEGLFSQDPALPSRLTLPSLDQYQVAAGLGAQLGPNIGLEIKAHARQNEDAWQLDDPLAAGLWTTFNVRRSRRVGVELSESSPLGGGFSQSLGLGWQNLELLDNPALLPTFAPALKGSASLGWMGEGLRAEVKASYVGSREGRALGGMSLPAYADLGASLEYEINASFSLLAEASNLLSQKVAEFPGYPEPSPSAGLGIKYQF